MSAATRGRLLRATWRLFRFSLVRPLVTAGGCVLEKRGWLLRLESGDGAVGWGEAAAIGDPWCEAPEPTVAQALAAIPPSLSREDLDALIPRLPPVLAFACGAALAEVDGLVGAAGGGWREAPPSARLLPAGEALRPALEGLLADVAAATPSAPLTLKWKVAAGDDALERRLLDVLLAWLPPEARLRLDANGGWDRPTASWWADRLAGDPRLAWLEQPLACGDQEGLEALATRIPVALDESLRQCPALRRRWRGWQVRRPSQDGDPRPLLQALRSGTPRLMVSTGFETGIGGRWLAHLAGLQWAGPTPAAPGLAPGWVPQGPLFHHDPRLVWEAAA